MYSKQCKHVKSDGSLCKAYSLKSSDGYCFFHDNRPEIIALREQAAKNAGNAQKLTFSAEVVKDELLPFKPIRLKKKTDVKRCIARILQETKSGTIDNDTARTLFYGFNVYLNALKTIDEQETKEEAQPVSPELETLRAHLRQGNNG